MGGAGWPTLGIWHNGTPASTLSHGHQATVQHQRSGGNRNDPRMAKYQGRVRKDPFLGLGLETASYDEILASNRWIVGSPETVIRKLRETLSVIRPGILGVWTNDGDTTHADTMRCLELMGREVLPALREIGEELELTDPFQKAAAAA